MVLIEYRKFYKEEIIMSHFTVLVIGENVEKQLAPFQENNMGDCPEEFLSFVDTEDEHLEEYETESSTRVVMPDGTLKYPWDEEFRKPNSIGIGGNTHEVPAHLEQKEIPFRELYSTFEEYMSDYCEIKSRDEKHNRYGHYKNPNAKWDWYQVGGRWTGFFKVKDGISCVVGKPGVFGRQPEPGYSDVCLKKYVDIEGMRKDYSEKANKLYDDLESATEGIEKPEWKSFKELCEKYPADKDIAEVRKEYWDNPFVVAASKSNDYFQWIDDDKEMFMTREEFVNRYCNRNICTFAVVKDGKWYERGEMGWWACVSNEKDDAAWGEEWNKLFADLPDDTLLTIVDCHI